MKKALVFIFALLCALTSYAQQFRLVGNLTGFATVVDDSTYNVSLSFPSDLTGNSFLPTQIADDGSYRIFFQTGRIYTVTGVANATFSDADLTLVEYGSTDGGPTGQALVFDPQGRESVPQAPIAASGASGVLNAAIISYNLQFQQGFADGDSNDLVLSPGIELESTTYTDAQALFTAIVASLNTKVDTLYERSDSLFYQAGGVETLFAVDTGGGGSLVDGDYGDVTVSGSGTVITINGQSVTFAKFQDIPENTLVGRDEAGTGSAETLTPAEVRTLLNVEDGATADQTATDVPITDAGAYYTGTDVEVALQEVADTLTDLRTDLSAIASGAADGVATAGAYDEPNEEIDVTVAAPGADFSIDVSSLASDSELGDSTAQVRSEIPTTASDLPIVDAGGYYTTSDVEAALQEEAVNRIAVDNIAGDLVTLSGVPITSQDLGTFTGTTISDNNDVKGALQELETAVESAGSVSSTEVVTSALSYTVSADNRNTIINSDVTSNDVLIILPDPKEAYGNIVDVYHNGASELGVTLVRAEQDSLQVIDLTGNDTTQFVFIADLEYAVRFISKKSTFYPDSAYWVSEPINETIQRVGDDIILSQKQSVSLNDFAKSVDVPTATSDLINDSNFLTTEVDGSTTNEIQTISLSDDILSISDGNTVDLSSLPIVSRVDSIDLRVDDKTSHKSSVELISDFNLKEGELLFYRSGEYELKKQPGVDEYYPFYYNILADQQTTGANLCRSSESLIDGTLDVWQFTNGVDGNSLPNGYIAPDGEKTADGIYTTSAFGRITQRVAPGLDSNQVYTFSYFYKGLDTDSSGLYLDFLVIDNVGGVVEPYSDRNYIYSDGIGQGYKRREFTFTTQQVFTDPLVRVQVNGGTGQDTFIVWGTQLEPYSEATLYKKTGTGLTDYITENDTLYMVKSIKDGRLVLNGNDRVAYNGDDASLLEDAANFCYNTGLCSEVQPVDGMVIDRSISWPEKISLRSMQYSPGGDGTDIYISPIDSNAVIFDLDDKGNSYVVGVTFENINFIVTTPTNAVIRTNRHLNFLAENCQILGNDQCDFGVVLGGSDTGAINGRLIDCTIQNCNTLVLVQNAGNIQRIENGVYIRGDIGIDVQGGSMIEVTRGADIENNNLYAVKVSQSGHVNINETYFENASIFLSGNSGVHFHHNRTSGGIIELGDSTSSVTIDYNKLASDFRVSGQYAKKLNVNNNFWASPANFYGTIAEFSGREYFNASGNYGEYFHQSVNYINGLPQNSNGGLHGDVVVNNVSLTGVRQNLVKNSDSLMLANGSYTYYDVFNNVSASPVTQDSTADLIVMTTSFGNVGRMPLSDRKIDAAKTTEGQTVTIVEWLKYASDSLEYVNYSYDLGAGVYSVGLNIPADNQWHPIVYVIDSLEVDMTQFKAEIRDPRGGDSIWFSAAQLFIGDEILSYIPTTGASIDDSLIVLTVPDGQELEIHGDLTVTGTLTSPDIMSSFTAAADTGTSSEIGDSETLTIAGGEGIYTEISGNTITTTLDLSELSVETSLGGNEFFSFYDSGNTSQWLAHIDTLLSYFESNTSIRSIYSPSGLLPDNGTYLNSDGAGFVITADEIDIQGVEVNVNGTPISVRTQDTLFIPIYAHPHDEGIVTGSADYRGWRVPADLNGAKIEAIQYSFDTPGSDTVNIQLTNGTVNIAGSTIPIAGYFENTGVTQTLTTGEKWTPSVSTINGTGHEGLMVNLMIVR